MRYAVVDTSFLIDAFERRASRAHDRLAEILGEVAAGRLTLVAPAPVVPSSTGARPTIRGSSPGTIASWPRARSAR